MVDFDTKIGLVIFVNAEMLLAVNPIETVVGEYVFTRYFVTCWLATVLTWSWQRQAVAAAVCGEVARHGRVAAQRLAVGEAAPPPRAA